MLGPIQSAMDGATHLWKRQFWFMKRATLSPTLQASFDVAETGSFEQGGAFFNASDHNFEHSWLDLVDLFLVNWSFFV